MRLNEEQRIEIILRVGSRSSRMVAIEWTKRGTDITHDTAAKLTFQKNWKCYRSAQMRRTRAASDEGTIATTLSALTRSPRKSSHKNCLCMETHGTPCKTIALSTRNCFLTIYTHFLQNFGNNYIVSIPSKPTVSYTPIVRLALDT